ncbi:MAG: GHKL domain-containing protein [Bacilli bacterium]|nr:GHKL domain-containing protein [Bacilli bacterium]
MKIVELVIGALFTVVATYYVSSKILDEKINLKLYKNVTIIIVQALLLSLFSSVDNTILRLGTNMFVLFIGNKLLFNIDIVKTLLASFMTFIIINIAEVLCAILLTLFFHIQPHEMEKLFFARILINATISIIMIVIIKIPIIRRKLQKMIKATHLKTNTSLFVIIAISIISMCILLYYIYFQINPLIGMALNTFITVGYLFLILNLFKEKNANGKIQSEFDSILKNMKEYEKILEIQRVKNHENENNLASLKGMIKKGDKEAIDFINTMIKEKNNDNQYLIVKTNSIPTGGLQGLVYQKLLLMKDKEIKYNLEISKSIDQKLLEGQDIELIKNMCTITGVFLDNAIQEVEKYKKKLVGIYLYKENDNLVISVSNNYEGILRVDMFDEKGYTTKGGGHGYGLSLVKEILNSTSKIVNERKINGSIFSQTLKIRVNEKN